MSEPRVSQFSASRLRTAGQFDELYQKFKNLSDNHKMVAISFCKKTHAPFLLKENQGDYYDDVKRKMMEEYEQQYDIVAGIRENEIEGETVLEFGYPNAEKISILMDKAENWFDQLEKNHKQLSDDEKYFYLGNLMYYLAIACPLKKGSAGTSELVYYFLCKKYDLPLLPINSKKSWDIFAMFSESPTVYAEWFKANAAEKLTDAQIASLPIFEKISFENDPTKQLIEEASRIQEQITNFSILYDFVFNKSLLDKKDKYGLSLFHYFIIHMVENDRIDNDLYEDADGINLYIEALKIEGVVHPAYFALDLDIAFSKGEINYVLLSHLEKLISTRNTACLMEDKDNLLQFNHQLIEYLDWVNAQYPNFIDKKLLNKIKTHINSKDNFIAPLSFEETMEEYQNYISTIYDPIFISKFMRFTSNIFFNMNEMPLLDEILKKITPQQWLAPLNEDGHESLLTACIHSKATHCYSYFLRSEALANYRTEFISILNDMFNKNNLESFRFAIEKLASYQNKEDDLDMVLSTLGTINNSNIQLIISLVSIRDLTINKWLEGYIEEYHFEKITQSDFYLVIDSFLTSSRDNFTAMITSGKITPSMIVDYMNASLNNKKNIYSYMTYCPNQEVVNTLHHAIDLIDDKFGINIFTFETWGDQDKIERTAKIYNHMLHNKQSDVDIANKHHKIQNAIVKSIHQLLEQNQLDMAYGYLTFLTIFTQDDYQSFKEKIVQKYSGATFFCSRNADKEKLQKLIDSCLSNAKEQQQNFLPSAGFSL